MNQKQVLFLHRTIELAQKAFQKSTSKPLVGWMITQQDVIICEGWLEQNLPYKPQLEKVFSQLSDNTDACLFLNTSPFPEFTTLSDLIRKYGIGKVIIADRDVPTVRSLCNHINRRWYVFHREKRPYIVLKWAQTKDRFIARSNFDSKWISGTHARKLVHQWRSQEAAIWVGKNTYLYDNPQLNVRNWVGEDPIRIVIDPQNTLDQRLKVFDQSQPTLYYSFSPSSKSGNLELISLPKKDHWKSLIEFVFDDLYQRKIASVFVEGGGQLLSFLVEHQWWDEARVFIAKKEFVNGIAAPLIDNKHLASETMVSEDRLLTYFRSTSEAEQEIKE